MPSLHLAMICCSGTLSCTRFIRHNEFAECSEHDAFWHTEPLRLEDYNVPLSKSEFHLVMLCSSL